VALADEVPPGGPPLPLRLLGEDLVLFRDDQDRLGLLGRHCAHRGADLSYGRCEDGGLRCLYHGWLYDVAGRCLEQPGEPAGSTFHQRIRQPAYPCQEAAGLVFAYFGPLPAPRLPALEIWDAPPERRYFRKYLQECNYLQANEGNLDPPHQSFLHRRLAPVRAAAREGGTRVDGTATTNFSLYREDVSPTIDLETTPFGLRVFVSRWAEPGKRFVRIYNFVMPNLSIVPGVAGAEGYTLNWHVPIDDGRHWKWQLTFWRGGTPDLDGLRRQDAAEVADNGRLRRTAANRYLQDRAEMQTAWYAGLGPLFVVHDACAQESAGPIQDRTAEHLGYGDKAIAAVRRLMLDAVRAQAPGQDPLGVVRAPAADWAPQLQVATAVVGEADDWEAWKHAARGATPRPTHRTAPRPPSPE
jgi:phenylpropionate dioxygenase-like ring-hydroxylating dioxygenase large terminal subunit